MNKAEKKFMEWMDEREIGYWFIGQDPETYSKVFGDVGVKRPDFMVFIENVGFVMVEVKGYGPHKGFASFTLNYAEVGKYDKLGTRYNVPVWYAFSYEDVKYEVWYWIPHRRAMEVGKVYSSKKGEEFLAIPSKEFRVVSVKDGIGRLFEGV